MSIVVEAFLDHIAKQVVAKYPGAKSALEGKSSLGLDVKGWDITVHVSDKDHRVTANGWRKIAERTFSEEEKKQMAEEAKKAEADEKAEEEWAGAGYCVSGWEGAMIMEPDWETFSVPLDDPKSIEKTLARIDEILSAPEVTQEYVNDSLTSMREMLDKVDAFHKRRDNPENVKLKSELDAAIVAQDFEKAAALREQYNALVGEVFSPVDFGQPTVSKT